MLPKRTFKSAQCSGASLFIRILSFAIALLMADSNSLVAAMPLAEPHGDLNVTNGTTAKKFGVHEVMLTGNAAAPNPFATAVSVSFLSPSGQTIKVDAF